MPSASTRASDLQDVAILLDVDGTILDLAPTPGDVHVPPSLRRTLQALWQRTAGALAFVSGRPVSDLDRIFAPLQIPIVGGHGAEIRIAGTDDPARWKHTPLDAAVKKKIAEIADAHPGILVEDKGYSLALHYRLAPDQEEFVRGAAASVCASLPKMPIELLPGKSMVEIKYAGFNKATGVRELMRHSPFTGRRPVFIGDDVTDQDVFAAMPEFDGIAIAVGTRYPGIAHLAAPEDVRRWLEQVAKTGHVAAP